MSPVLSGPTKFQELSQRVSQPQILRDALKQAKVPEATLKTVLEQVEQQQQQ